MTHEVVCCFTPTIRSTDELHVVQTVSLALLSAKKTTVKLIYFQENDHNIFIIYHHTECFSSNRLFSVTNSRFVNFNIFSKKQNFGVVFSCS